jgi:hypothetical protein
MSIVVVGEELPLIPKQKKIITIDLVDLDEFSLVGEMMKVADLIAALNTAFDVVNSTKDPVTHDRICFRLNAAEREFFLLFNQYRVYCGLQPYEGERFIGEFNYATVFINR